VPPRWRIAGSGQAPGERVAFEALQLDGTRELPIEVGRTRRGAYAPT